MESPVRVSVFAAAALAGLIAPLAGASAQEMEKSFEFRDFNRIAVAGVYHLEVDVGGDYSVKLTGPAHEMERVETYLKGSTLKLDLRDRRFGEKRGKHEGIEARVTLPSLVGLHMSGVVDGEVRGVNSDTFEVAISGVGEMRIAGECNQLKAEVSGVGGLDSKGLKCRDVKVIVSGVGEATVYAIDAVDAIVSGMGDITVHGSPKHVKKSGGMFADISIR